VPHGRLHAAPTRARVVRLDLHLDNNKQAAAIASERAEQRSGGQVSAVYQRLRERCQASLRAPPTRIVEIDQPRLKSMRGEVDE